MQPEITKIIEQYLAGELSASDKAAFEERLQTNSTLQEEVAFQQAIHQAAKRSAMRAEVAKASGKFHLNQQLKWGGIVAGAALVIASTIALITSNLESKSALTEQEFRKISHILEKKASIDLLASEFFSWNGADTALLSKDGVLISIPSNALLLDGKPYTNQAVIQWQEALDGATIVKSGLSTMSDGKLLETQGMFSFAAFTADGQQLSINPKVGIYVQVPVDEYKEGMQLFDGKKEIDGSINWVKPRALEKIPVPVDMRLLDFYPVDYESTLDKLKLRKDKKFRDSLYLSCENEETIVEKEEVKPIPKQTTSQNHALTIEELEMNNKKSGIKNQTAQKDINWKDNVKWEFSVEYLPNNEANIIGKATLKEGWHIFSVDHNPDDADQVGIPTSFTLPSTINFQNIDQLKDGQKPYINYAGEYRSKWFIGEATFKQKIEIWNKNPFDLPFTYQFQICNAEGCVFPPDQKATVRINPRNISVSTATVSTDLGYIPPSKVLAFWQPKFNNTILSTREFEKRMVSIHGTCSEKVLEVYTKNLSKPLHELDSRVAAMGHPEFNSFAAENVGAMNPNDPHLKGLTEFYEKGIASLRSELKRNRDNETTRQNNWDQKVSSERSKESSRTVQREAQAFNEEYSLNHKNVRKQLGRTLGAKMYGVTPICNIDAFVMQTTRARKTAEFYDVETGKTARIQYNDFTFQIDNAKEYTQLFAYLFPSKLNSYQRISGKNGSFSYPLNEEILYDLAIVGINEKGYAFFQKHSIKGGELGEIHLAQISEKQLTTTIEALNNKRLDKPMAVRDELEWLITEQKNYLEQRFRKEQRELKVKIKKVVFPCYEASGQPLIESDTLSF